VLRGTATKNVLRDVERTDKERAWRANWLSGHVVFLEGAVFCADYLRAGHLLIARITHADQASTNHMSRETPGIQEGAAGPDF
jgi:hypothetical protein